MPSLQPGAVDGGFVAGGLADLPLELESVDGDPIVLDVPSRGSWVARYPASERGP